MAGPFGWGFLGLQNMVKSWIKESILFIVLLNKCDKLPEDYIASDDSVLFDFLISVDNPVFCSGLTGFGKKEVLRTIGEKLIRKVAVWNLINDCAL